MQPGEPDQIYIVIIYVWVQLNTANQNRYIFAPFMSRNIFISIFSIYLAALLFPGSCAQLQEFSQSHSAKILSNEPVAEQLKVNSLRPQFAEINFSGIQQIIVHPFKGFGKNSATFLRFASTQFLIKWNSSKLRSLTIEPGLSISKIIFPTHFFW